MPSQWQEFFDNHAPHYDQNNFVRHTKEEADFFLSLFPIERGAKILDVGCGTGRHCVEFARRGFQMTGLDLSQGMLDEAQKKVGNLPIRLVKADATNFELNEVFDAAFSLCEGAFNLLSETEDAELHDRSILQNIARHLKPGAPFLLTALNGYQIIRQMDDNAVQLGAFNPITMVAHYKDELDLPEGKKEIVIRERLFIPPEMVKLLNQTGFRCEYVFGGTAGDWGRRPLRLDEIEAMYVCRRL